MLGSAAAPIDVLVLFGRVASLCFPLSTDRTQIAATCDVSTQQQPENVRSGVTFFSSESGTDKTH